MGCTSTVLLHNTANSLNVTGVPLDVSGRHRFTVSIRTANLTGTVVIEATLLADPTDQDWFPVASPVTYPRANQRDRRDAYGFSFLGSFASVRAKLVRPGASVSPDISMFGVVDQVLINC